MVGISAGMGKGFVAGVGKDILGTLSIQKEGGALGSQSQASPHWISGSDPQAYQSQWGSHPKSR